MNQTVTHPQTPVTEAFADAEKTRRQLSFSAADRAARIAAAQVGPPWGARRDERWLGAFEQEAARRGLPGQPWGARQSAGVTALADPGGRLPS